MTDSYPHSGNRRNLPLQITEEALYYGIRVKEPFYLSFLAHIIYEAILDFPERHANEEFSFEKYTLAHLSNLS